MAFSCTSNERPQPHEPDLVYVNRRFVPAIDDWVEYVKTPTSVRVDTPWGEMSPAAFRRGVAARWRLAHGALTPQLETHLATAPEGSLVDVMLVYEDPASRGLYRLARSHDPSVRSEALVSVRALLAARAGVIVTNATALGFKVRQASKYLPIVFGTVPVAQAHELGQLEHLVAVDRYVALGGKPEYHAARNFVTDPKHDIVNNAGYAGQGIRVGLAEIVECGVYDKHESLNGAVTYSTAPLACMVHSDCFGTCDSLSRCLDNKCVHRHTTEVASVLIGNSDGQTWGAGKAELFVYNGPDNPNCDPVGRDRAYAWFLDNDVKVVSHTFGCSLGATGQDGSKYGLIQDYYAQKYGILTAKSAGNRADVGKQACPTTLNGICVGAALSFTEYGGASIDYMWALSNWRNPFYDDPEVNSDREEPDVVALGGDVDVMDMGSSTGWTRNSGTSFSTPAVASMAASIMSAHPGMQNNPIWARVCFALSGRNRDVDNMWRYSTPGKGFDFKDGAGGVDATLPLALCGEGDGINDGIITITIDTTGGDDPPPGDEPPPDDPPPGQQPLSALSASSSSRQVLVVGTYQLSKDRRVRSVMAWHTCVGQNYASGGVAPSTVRLDLDLMLYRHPAGSAPGKYIYLSQSLDDNIEGFDLIIPEAGTHTLFVSWPDGDTGCNSATLEDASVGILGFN